MNLASFVGEKAVLLMCNTNAIFLQGTEIQSGITVDIFIVDSF